MVSRPGVPCAGGDRCRGPGIHVDAIAHVVNYDLPQVPKDFIHRVGRTGRAGARGTATTFCTRGERGDITRIERLLGVKLQRLQVSGDVPREVRSEKVVVIPSTRSFQPRQRQFRRAR